jgi:hypothetical protein
MKNNIKIKYENINIEQLTNTDIEQLTNMDIEQLANMDSEQLANMDSEQLQKLCNVVILNNDNSVWIFNNDIEKKYELAQKFITKQKVIYNQELKQKAIKKIDETIKMENIKEHNFLYELINENKKIDINIKTSEYKLNKINQQTNEEEYNNTISIMKEYNEYINKAELFIEQNKLYDLKITYLINEPAFNNYIFQICDSIYAQNDIEKKKTINHIGYLFILFPSIKLTVIDYITTTKKLYNKFKLSSHPILQQLNTPINVNNFNSNNPQIIIEPPQIIQDFTNRNATTNTNQNVIINANRNANIHQSFFRRKK